MACVTLKAALFQLIFCFDKKWSYWALLTSSHLSNMLKCFSTVFLKCSQKSRSVRFTASRGFKMFGVNRKQLLVSECKFWELCMIRNCITGEKFHSNSLINNYTSSCISSWYKFHCAVVLVFLTSSVIEH